MVLKENILVKSSMMLKWKGSQESHHFRSKQKIYRQYLTFIECSTNTVNCYDLRSYMYCKAIK